MKTYPRKGLRPVESRPNTFVDFKAYRNHFKGLLVFFAHNLILDGGIFADNAVNLDIDKAINVHVFDAEIIGESELYRQQIAAQNIRHLCLNNMVVGLQLNTNNGSTGVTVHSASFAGFSKSRCGNEFPARLNNQVSAVTAL